MKILTQALIAVLLVSKSVFAHGGESEGLKAGKYEFGVGFEITSGESARQKRIFENVIKDDKKATYQYYTISNAFGFTENVSLGLNINYARAIYKSSRSFQSNNETFTGHHETYNEIYHKWQKHFGGHFGVAIKNSFLDIAYSRRNSDLAYKMYQLGFILMHEGEGFYKASNFGISYAKGLANKSLQGHNVDIMHLNGGIVFAVIDNLNLNFEVEMEFEFMKASDIKSHGHYDANAFLFNQSYKPKVAQSTLRVELEREFHRGITAKLGIRYDLGGKETRNEKGIFLGLKKMI
jgi:hypothetical protein